MSAAFWCRASPFLTIADNGPFLTIADNGEKITLTAVIEDDEGLTAGFTAIFYIGEDSTITVRELSLTNTVNSECGNWVRNSEFQK
ncbi:MAG: hypothetical protein ACE5PV_13725 [Candidatus Poribacteria bacterium]